VAQTLAPGTAADVGDEPRIPAATRADVYRTILAVLENKHPGYRFSYDPEPAAG
jgi:hypothetical protein